MDSDIYNAIRSIRDIDERIEDIVYIYTLIFKDGNVEFVMDAAKPGDNDGDGVEDRAELGEVYEDLNDQMLEVLNRKDGTYGVTTEEPYQDKWGTFMTGYAPLLNSDGKQVAAVAVIFL